ncbi:MAG: hypothetical protein AB1938_10170 [Myxococcota bacterium]
MGSHSSNDPKLLPVPYKPRSDGRLDIEHQLHEWTSGTRGGGRVPKDFAWGTNPKQTQEELGAAEAEKPLGG